MTHTDQPKLREAASAILFDTAGRLLLQQRDNIPGILYPGKIGLFGGQREGDESFLECIVREIHEELSYYLPPDRFELLARRSAPDYENPSVTVNAELFIASGLPVEQLTVTEGSLKIVAVEELEQIRPSMAPPTQYAFDTFVKLARPAVRVL